MATENERLSPKQTSPLNAKFAWVQICFGDCHVSLILASDYPSLPLAVSISQKQWAENWRLHRDRHAHSCAVTNKAKWGRWK